MKYTATPILLSSGYHMPPIGLGTWQLEDEESIRKTLRTAIALGYRYIDTAFNYKNESLLGEELQKMFEEGLIEREQLFITTKLPQHGMRPENVEYFFMKSLNALQLDYVDLYLIHSPIPSQRTEDDESFLPIKDGDVLVDYVDLEDTWEAMESLVDKGLVRSIGISNFNSQQIQKIYEAARIKPSALQVECHAYLPQYELVEFCKKLDIAVIGYSPLGSPGLPDYFSKTYAVKFNPPRLLDEQRIKQIAEKHEKTSAQVLLRYQTQRSIIPIPKSVDEKRLKENFEVFNFDLDEDDLKILKSMANGFRYFKFDFAKSVTEHPEQPFKIPF